MRVCRTVVRVSARRPLKSAVQSDAPAGLAGRPLTGDWWWEPRPEAPHAAEVTRDTGDDSEYHRRTPPKTVHTNRGKNSQFSRE